jgi:YidC/Oxa1 family membrane protein insertase
MVARLVLLLGIALAATFAADDAPPAAAQTAVTTAASTAVPTTTYNTVALENPAAWVIISSQRASIDRFELKSSHPITLPGHLHRQMVATDPGLDGKPSLAVLDAFSIPPGVEATRLAKNQHHWLANDADTALGWGIRGTETTPWTIISRSPTEAAFAWDNGRGLQYRITYRLHATLAQVAVEVQVNNTGSESLTLKPAITLVNGIHQDYAPNEAAYLAAFVHRGGDQSGTIKTTSVPATNSGWSLVTEPDASADFVGIKSRFFAVWWRPGKVGLVPAAGAGAASAGPVAPVAAGPEAPVPGAVANGAPSVDGNPAWRADVAGFTTQEHLDHQARLVVSYGTLALPAGRTLAANWTLSASGMSSTDLKALTPSEQRIELTDMMHKFFILPTRALTWFLDMIVWIVPNYAVAVILLTFLVKAAMFRLTWKQHASMIKMQKLAPDLKYIQEQYKNDKSKLAQKQMELWKKHGVNPLGGCLPLLIQMPIFIALYNTFQYNADMRGASFLWVTDLTLPDQVWGVPLAFLNNWILSLNPLPLIYIAVTIWMSLTTPIPTTAAGGDPMQEQIAKSMRWMPVLFGLIFYNMPAGLVLYFTVNAVISTIEVKFIRRRLNAN